MLGIIVANGIDGDVGKKFQILFPHLHFTKIHLIQPMESLVLVQ